MTKFIPYIHPLGFRYVLIGLVVTVLLTFVAWWTLFISVPISIWLVTFFRDPERKVVLDDNLIIAPADGVIQSIEEAIPPAELGVKKTKMLRIATFMNIFNCHINRSPVTGTIKKTAHRRGAFVNASLDKASDLNERFSMIVGAVAGHQIIVTQIAGLIARRIVFFLKKGDKLQQGQRFGMIMFGSRVDVYLPPQYRPLISEGTKVIAGQSLLAELVANPTGKTRAGKTRAGKTRAGKTRAGKTSEVSVRRSIGG